MSDNAGVADSLMDHDAPPKRAGGICAPWKWFLEKPLQRKSFIMFLIPAALTVVWLIMFITSVGSATSYILAGVAAIIMSALGANHFRILLALKEEVDKMSRLNQQFRMENMALQQEVDKLGRAREQLSSVEAGLKESNRKLKDNVEKFRKLDENLKKLADSNIVCVRWPFHVFFANLRIYEFRNLYQVILYMFLCRRCLRHYGLQSVLCFVV